MFDKRLTDYPVVLTLIIAILLGTAGGTFYWLTSQSTEPVSRLTTFDFSRPVAVCELASVPVSVKQINSAQCTEQRLGSIDTQGRLLAVRLSFDAEPRWLNAQDPVGLWLFAKAASSVFLNGQLLGHNGRPAADSAEIPGRIDSSFFIPANLLQPSANELVLVMSAQHGLLKLGFPLYFLALGDYSSPGGFYAQKTVSGLILVGMFLVGMLFFFALGLGRHYQRGYRYMALLSLIAGLHQFAEIYRGLYGYDYPVHDLRLLLVTACAVAFGLVLLGYSASLFNPKNRGYG
ncbi:hypothetical protein [Alteromonas gilva]|uniref:Uncharacterized protein n=1 Tax=Alteromonas gilva TaxID=2987522 RepID=A0ABT5L7N1_9ALTE|nr:hypothetical protein [Alteromonas gilva]MDC8832434.1 hypothetical protein [Alteromonas gilva]